MREVQLSVQNRTPNNKIKIHVKFSKPLPSLINKRYDINCIDVL